MTKEERDDIRERCEADIPYADLGKFAVWALDALPELLDLVEAEKEREDNAEANYARLNRIDNSESAKMLVDRDRWKSRAEALEMALKMQQPCFVCQLRLSCSPSEREQCRNKSCLFEFDQARITGDGA